MKQNAVPYTEIDMETYPRKAHFDYFCSLSNPYVGVTVQVDVTQLVAFCKREGCSFYLTMIHLAALAADGVKEFRQRISNGGIVEFAHCPTSHTELLEDDTYCYCTLRHDMPWEAYLPYAEKQREKSRQESSLEENDTVLSEYFISAVPWLHYTDIFQPTSSGEQSNPRITWGKFEADAQGKLRLPVTVLVHHALADGLHLSRFYANLETEIQKLTHRAQI